MLEKLVINNIALIDSAEIEFSEGLNVLSGETGSGKSVIIESLNFVLGAKADKSLIRSGEKECLVKAEFNVCGNEAIYNVYRELDFEQDDLLIISRKMSLDGKGGIKVNGNAVTLGMLRQFTVHLVDIHGQSEHFFLLKNSNQLDLIDKLGGADISEILNTCCEEYRRYKDLNRRINEIGGDEASRAIRLDVLNYQINEIESADLKENEESELNSLKQKLFNYEKIVNALNTVYESFSQENGAGDIISYSQKILGGISSISPEYSELYERLDNVYTELEDVAETARRISENLDGGDLDAEYIDNRLETIKKLKKKYGDTIEQINDFCSRAKEEKHRLENISEISEKLFTESDEVKKRLYFSYCKLSAARKKTAETFSESILKELSELSIDKAQFYVDFSQEPTFEKCGFDSPQGFDKIEFMFSANAGEPVKPLSAVISGGEISRFMLAIKVQTSKFNNISTFIFDEIDAGISGAVARTVAEKFAKISLNTQIIAISHLPQISAMADCNLLISKSESSGKTYTSVRRLDEKSKIDEIIRLSGGSAGSESAQKHAEELIKIADNYKLSLRK